MPAKERNFFAAVAWAASRLSDCEQHEGAVIISGNRIAAYGYNRVLVETYDVSAISDAMSHCQPGELQGAMIVSTRFPTFADMKALIISGVTKICFFGPIVDPETVKLVNAYTESNSNTLEILKLELEQKLTQPG